MPVHDSSRQPSSRRRSLPTRPLLVGAAVAAVCAVVAVRDPHRSGSYGVCPILLLTGHPCPGCGALRATWDLLHGHVGAAVATNPWWVATIPVLLAWWLWWLVLSARGSWTPRHSLLGARLALGIIVLGLLFGVMRIVLGQGSVLGP